MEFLQWIESWRNPVFTAFFAAVTALGSEDFLLAFMAVVYWCVNRTLALRLMLVLVVSIYLNDLLKMLAHTARPGPPLTALEVGTGGGYAWPSGHAQQSASLWATLAGLIRRPWAWAGALLIIFLVGFSRLYLGLHWPIDVVSGWAIGVLIALAALALFSRMADFTAEDVPSVVLGVGLVVVVVLLVLFPYELAVRILGAGTGAAIGWWLERRLVGFEAAAPLPQQLIKLVIGLAVLLGLRFALKPLVDPWAGDVIGPALRYALLGFWLVFAAPWIFKKIWRGQS